jgi:hypothetical protein
MLPLALQAAERPEGVWIDPKLTSLPHRPWRKVHLDFHNSQYVQKIGAGFDANAFGDTLQAANVDAVVVFAKDMHGYFYYPSKYGPVHPGLDFDLLGAQVEACRKRKIAVYAYYCSAWDNYLAENHPEWLALNRNRESYLPKFNETPGWTALCIANQGFVSLVSRHTREFVSRYAIDGAWFDMPYPRNGECFCDVCLRQLREKGQDPLDNRVQKLHKQALEIQFLKGLHDIVTETRPGCQVDFNNQAVYGLGARAQYMDNIDLEALPTASGWGYYYFPLVVRYTRTFGLTTYGMTGRFVASWADFGGLKLPSQLDTELASIVANAARCDIGDQMPPSGKLDPAVYDVIGKSYAKIRKLQPYLEGAAPVCEAALLISGLPMDQPNTEENLGLTKLLSECRVQFDAVEPDEEWERYRLLVLPDSLSVNEELSARLRAYVGKGGALLVSNHAGVTAGTKESWLAGYGLQYAGDSPYKPAYMVPKVKMTGDIPAYEYALYEGATQWRAAAPARVVAKLGEPAFQRSPQHFTSHAQSPFDHETDYAALALSGRVGLAAFPLGQSYFNRGYWVYRYALRYLLDGLLPEALIKSDAPVSAELTVNYQKTPQPRYIVHIVNWSANRGTPKHPVFHDEPIALTDLTIELALPVRGDSVRAVNAGVELPITRAGGRAVVKVPRVAIHELLIFEAA